MKKYLLLAVIMGLILGSNALAAATILTGKVASINPDAANPNTGSFTIIKNINWLEKLTGAFFKKPQNAPITIQVTPNTKFSVRTSKEAGFTDGNFSDLKVDDRVVVSAEETNQTYTALEVKIVGRFIPSPKHIPEIKQCQTDADCSWCGMSCVNKEEIKDKACAQVMPKPGTSCKCVDNRCMVVPLTGPTSTSTPPVTLQNRFQNKAQVLQEMERVRAQIKILEQRLKELEKILKVTPNVSKPASSTQ